jgi:hypothetical protein
MATNEAKVIQELLDQVAALRKAIQSAGDEGRTKVKDIKVDELCNAVPQTAGKVDDAAWSTLPGDKQKELHDRIVQVRDFLHQAASIDGPSDPKHIMSGTYASTGAIVLWMLVSFLLVVFLLCEIITQWDRATGTDFAPRIQASTMALAQLDSARDLATKASAAQGVAASKAAGMTDDVSRKAAQQEVEALAREAAARRAEVDRAELNASLAAIEAVRAITKGGATENIVLLMVTLLGALGGSLHLVGSLVKYIGNRQLKRSWLPYYLSLPFVGAALAPIVYMLLRVGILTPSGAANGGLRTADLNLIGIYAFAALAGMFAKTATDKLSEVFSTIFRTEERTTRDPIASEKPPGGTAQAAPKTP